MTRAIIQLLLLSCLAFAVVAQVKQTDHVGDPAIEVRLHNLAQQLRCLVCQSETLADSQADHAVDLRNQMRELMNAGKTDDEIVAYLTARYGNYVRFLPPVIPTTYPLWYLPFVLLPVGLLLLFRYVRLRRELIVEKPLSQEERSRAEKLLKEQPVKETM